jgi:hypothetical protein
MVLDQVQKSSENFTEITVCYRTVKFKFFGLASAVVYFWFGNYTMNENRKCDWGVL